MLIDSHCHIHDDDFGIPVPEILAHAHENGVDKMITIGTSMQSSPAAQKFASQHDEVFWTFGYHPHEFNGDIAKLEQFLDDSKPLFEDKKLVAIGEIGLDYYYEPYDREAQIKLLERMLQLAQDRKLPVSFHVRSAFDDFWPIADNFKLAPSVMHCFSDNEQNLAECLKRGWVIGVNGLSTFAQIPHAPLASIILETDAPYLTPKPFRGTINKPGYIKNIAEWAAQYYQVDFEEVASITTQNVERIFKI